MARESAEPSRWVTPADWLISCAGAWVYGPPDLEEPKRAQGCAFMRFHKGGGVVVFHVTAVESTLTSAAYLSNGDGFLIEFGK